MSKIAPCLWFDGQALEAAEFYVSLFAGSRIDTVHRLAAATPATRPDDVLWVEFTLAGVDHIALNGGPNYAFTPAISLFARCADQAEVDRLWDALVDGGRPGQCGWLTDRYGVTWQIVPVELAALMEDRDPQRAGRVLQALMGMVKLDLAALRRAGDGA
ncbi:MAG: VOC family protein [Rhodospirillaceae bacterium]|nr:VOC family protein [Rhodospirillaceae bacterium]